MAWNLFQGIIQLQWERSDYGVPPHMVQISLAKISHHKVLTVKSSNDLDLPDK